MATIAEKTVYRKVISRLGDALICLGILVLIVVLFSELNLGPLSFKYIQSGSMLPAIHVGDMAVIYKTGLDSIKTGDVISFVDPENREVVHRVISTAAGCTVTKGDANNTPDQGCVAHMNGKLLFHIPLLGYAFGFIKLGILNLIRLLR